MSSLRRLLPYLDRYRLRYLGGAACLLLATAFSLSIPWTVKSAVDALERDGIAARIGPYVLLILALAAAHGAARLGSRFAMLGAGQWVEHDIRADLYARLLALPAAFYQRHRTGDLMSRASNDVSTLRALAGFGTVMLISTTLAFAGALAAMWLIDPWLTLFAMAPFPGLVIIAKRFHHDTEVRSAAVQEQLGVLSAKVQENLTGMPVVRAYTMEAREAAEFERLNAEYLTRNLALARIQSVFWPLMGLVSGMGVLIVMWLGGKAVVDGRISLGAFVAFNGYLAQLAWPTIALGWTLASIQRGLAAMARVTEVLDERAQSSTVPGETSASAPGDLPTSYRAARSSSGTSRSPTTTSVGPCCATCRSRCRRGRGGGGGADGERQVHAGHAAVPTLRAAARHGVARRDRRARSAARPASAVGRLRAAGGVPLLAPAAGQRAAGRRARGPGAPARRWPGPPGWPTIWARCPGAGTPWWASAASRSRAASASGWRSRARWWPTRRSSSWTTCSPRWTRPRSGRSPARLRGAASGRTTLLMTHRLKAAAEADAIVVLDEGRVVEQGRHAELVAAGGLYARLWRVQQLEDELDQCLIERPSRKTRFSGRPTTRA